MTVKSILYWSCIGFKRLNF